MPTVAVPHNLVEWACKHAIGLRRPADRPWYFAGRVPPGQTEVTRPCHCGRFVVGLRRYRCESDGEVFIGQCLSGPFACEAVTWAYRECDGR